VPPVQYRLGHAASSPHHRRPHDAHVDGAPAASPLFVDQTQSPDGPPTVGSAHAPPSASRLSGLVLVPGRTPATLVPPSPPDHHPTTTRPPPDRHPTAVPSRPFHHPTTPPPLAQPPPHRCHGGRRPPPAGTAARWPGSHAAATTATPVCRAPPRGPTPPVGRLGALLFPLLLSPPPGVGSCRPPCHVPHPHGPVAAVSGAPPVRARRGWAPQLPGRQ